MIHVISKIIILSEPNEKEMKVSLTNVDISKKTFGATTTCCIDLSTKLCASGLECRVNNGVPGEFEWDSFLTTDRRYGMYPFKEINKTNQRDGRCQIQEKHYNIRIGTLIAKIDSNVSCGKDD